MDTTRLQGRVALITGAGQGIGRAIACRFLQEGARVTIVDSDEAAAQDARDEYHHLGEVDCLKADVGQAGEIAALAAFLASSEAGFITGSCYLADGGMTRKMIYV